MNRNQVLSTMAALGAVLFFSTGGLCVKVIEAGPLYISGMRSLVAFLFFFAVFGLQGKWREMFRLSPVGWATAVSYAMVVSMYVIANKLTTAANVIFLQYTMPAWVLIGGALFLGERVTFGRVTSIVLCLMGMIFFFQGDMEPGDWSGNVVALGAGLSFAVMTLLIRFGRKKTPLHAIMMGNLITALTNLPMALLLVPSDFYHVPEVGGMISILWLGIFQIGIAYICYTAALRGLPAIEVAILMLLEPILNPLLVYWEIGEVPSGWAFVGGGIIMISVLIRIIFVREKV
ncbi:EamA family transporter [bacterium]|nr:EamA family transporter [bacterium]